MSVTCRIGNTNFDSRGWVLLLLLFALILQASPAIAAEFTPPPAMLANVYHNGVPLADYLISEKLDGVRGYWDGTKLLTRGGEQIAAPDWFTAGWPDFPLDGELWMARGQFSAIVSIVRKNTPDDASWRTLRYMVFDLPAQAGDFEARNQVLQTLLSGLAIPWLQPVEQYKVTNRAGLRKVFEQVVNKGGEGLMLHRAASLYQAGRSDDLLKLKPYQDADAIVISHLPGKGKHRGALGALLVETPEGLRFRLGTGFSAAQRRKPPTPGSWVSYRYIGMHEGSGIPRFASFIRVRGDLPPVQK